MVIPFGWKERRTVEPQVPDALAKEDEANHSNGGSNLKGCIGEIDFRHVTGSVLLTAFASSKEPRMILIGAPMLTALAALIASISTLMWSIRRKA